LWTPVVAIITHRDPSAQGTKNAPHTHTHTDCGRVARPSSVISLFLSLAPFKNVTTPLPPPPFADFSGEFSYPKLHFPLDIYIYTYLYRIRRRINGPACLLYRLFFNNCVKGVYYGLLGRVSRTINDSV